MTTFLMHHILLNYDDIIMKNVFFCFRDNYAFIVYEHPECAKRAIDGMNISLFLFLPSNFLFNYLRSGTKISDKKKKGYFFSVVIFQDSTSVSYKC